ncbi:hypothetical protein SAMN02745671_01181 [Anaerovibrio lipolyticus DSM 3074]|uniref:Uncharacterized protein n=1 Tax=Anaerovibrio lipolyticus DSM 3074 TaxID=1120997 RepID=A0A1M6CMN5_9FIRM|nr:hypothetical protein [Anaerovibrio lipolyticus]SHI62111.1 hypothetical protein SAMN02745671_01181 [Anaerovibrio lipolyticus DSM 3074]
MDNNSDYVKEINKLVDEVEEKAEKLFEKYEKVPSHGLDKPGMNNEFVILHRDFANRKRDLMKKYGIKEEK